MGATDVKKENKSSRRVIVVLVLATLMALAASTYCFYSGYFIVHQNLFYIPIVISCVFFARKGFVFSVILALAYFSLLVCFTRNSTLISEAVVRIGVFTAIAGITSYFSLKLIRTEEEKSKAYAQLKSVIDSASQVSIIATDLSGKIITFNSGAERMLGYSAREMMNKTPVVIHLESEVVQRGKELSKELGRPVEGFDVFVAYAREGRYEEREWTYVEKDGSRLIVNLVVTAVRDDTDQIIGFLGIANDITERKKLENELREKIHNLEVFHKVAVGRELKMKELKERIAELEAKLKEIGTRG